MSSIAAERLYGQSSKTPEAKHDDPTDPIAQALYGGGGTTVKVSVDVKVPDSKSAADVMYPEADMDEADIEKICEKLEAMEPASEDQVKQWAEETRKLLQDTHGDQVETKLEIVREYLGQFPRLVSALETSGLGSHAASVARAIKHVEDRIQSGKFKSKKARSS